MSSHKKILLLSGLSIFVLCSSLDAEARRHKSGSKGSTTDATDQTATSTSDGDKTADKTADKAADKTGTAAAPSGDAAATAAGGAAAKPPAAPAGQTAAPAGAPPPAAGAPPPPAAPPKELASETSGPRQEAARAHFERGVELYTYGDFPNAWLEFNSAYQVVPLVDLLNNLARCEVRMGRQRDALEHFRSFITARPNDQDSEYIRQEIARLEGEVGRTTAAQNAPPEPVAAPAPPRPRHVPVYGILVGATTIAMLIAGATTLGLVNGRYNSLHNQCGSSCPPMDVNVLQTQSYAGDGLLGVGAAGAVATGLILYFELSGSKETALRPLASLGFGTPLGVIGRY
jgi:hypothetical protein